MSTPSEVVATTLKEHPELCKNRLEALQLVLCTQNTDYVWQDGTVRRVTPINFYTPPCDAAIWWSKISSGPVPPQLVEHMNRRKERIETIRSDAEKLASETDCVPCEVLPPEENSLLLTSPQLVSPEWEGTLKEIWQLILAAHCTDVCPCDTEGTKCPHCPDKS